MVLTLACVSFAGAAIASTYRSQKARRDFANANPCPSTKLKMTTCPGYVIDHIIPLDCGGPDLPSNMQWQTIGDAKAKDKVERSSPNCKHPTLKKSA
jgi:hypothetical protein